jgi:hypothetical protein
VTVNAVMPATGGKTMQTSSSQKHASLRSTGSWDRFEYRFLVTLSFFLCLAVAVIARISGHASGEGGQSIFAQAKANAHAAIGYAFHG